MPMKYRRTSVMINLLKTMSRCAELFLIFQLFAPSRFSGSFFVGVNILLYPCVIYILLYQVYQTSFFTYKDGTEFLPFPFSFFLLRSESIGSFTPLNGVIIRQPFSVSVVLFPSALLLPLSTLLFNNIFEIIFVVEIFQINILPTIYYINMREAAGPIIRNRPYCREGWRS